MGMGLSICRSIIEAHGGRLWATRCEPRGALFQFTIPVLALYRVRRANAEHVARAGNFPEIRGSRLTRCLGYASPILLPLVFLIAWLIVWSRANL
jgi:hypothetical protein